MANKRQPSFNPKSFLAKVGEGRSINTYRKGQTIFSQGDPADAVFYIQKGSVRITVVSEQGKEAVVAILGTNDFFGEGDDWNDPFPREFLHEPISKTGPH